MQTVAVLDYGMSNLRSVARALEFVAGGSHRIVVTDNAQQLLEADRVVFPGQGAIGQCMVNLARLGLEPVLADCLKTRPYLGICLGLQTLMQSSAEDGGTAGLGFIQGTVTRFPADMTDHAGARFKIPHMGWNQVVQIRDHPLWHGIESGERFYFVHSFFVRPAREKELAGGCIYGVEFAAALARDKLFAVQFHPEKSQRAGLTLLRNFLDWRP